MTDMASPRFPIRLVARSRHQPGDGAEPVDVRRAASGPGDAVVRAEPPPAEPERRRFGLLLEDPPAVDQDPQRPVGGGAGRPAREPLQPDLVGAPGERLPLTGERGTPGAGHDAADLDVGAAAPQLDAEDAL